MGHRSRIWSCHLTGQVTLKQFRKYHFVVVWTTASFSWMMDLWWGVRFRPAKNCEKNCKHKNMIVQLTTKCVALMTVFSPHYHFNIRDIQITLQFETFFSGLCNPNCCFFVCLFQMTTVSFFKCPTSTITVMHSDEGKFYYLGKLVFVCTCFFPMGEKALVCCWKSCEQLSLYPIVLGLFLQ